MPLLLATAGVLVTFAAGLWNIGVEGQIMLGAVLTTWVLRLLQDTTLSPALIIVLAMLAGIVGGALWAALAGVLKTFGGVNEIFGGLGLNFVATALTLWLIFGPWKRPGVGSMSGTEPFPDQLALPTVGGSRLSLWSLGLGILAVILVYIAPGAHLFRPAPQGGGQEQPGRVPTGRAHLAVHAAGLPVLRRAGRAGRSRPGDGRLPPPDPLHLQRVRLPGADGGMLIGYRAIWVAPVALFFAALNIGSIQLPIVLKLDSSLSGVLQGALVLLVILVEGRGSATCVERASGPQNPTFPRAPARRCRSGRQGRRQRLKELKADGRRQPFSSVWAGCWLRPAPIVFATIGETSPSAAGSSTSPSTAPSSSRRWAASPWP